jgi:hypothetical protein
MDSLFFDKVAVSKNCFKKIGITNIEQFLHNHEMQYSLVKNELVKDARIYFFTRHFSSDGLRVHVKTFLKNMHTNVFLESEY